MATDHQWKRAHIEVGKVMSKALEASDALPEEQAMEVTSLALLQTIAVELRVARYEREGRHLSPGREVGGARPGITTKPEP